MSPVESIQSSQFGFTHFLAQADGVSLFLFAVLLLMSVATWAIVLSKLRASARLQKNRSNFAAQGFEVDSEESSLGSNDSDYARLLCDARRLLEMFNATQSSGSMNSKELAHLQEALDRTLQQSLDAEASRMDSGQTALASIASCAPFVGLFGTVWGIYHALLGLGVGGQSTLDQVAGPVGEALIMTALGLAVAIPAALAFNLFQRQSRVTLGQLERFAHDFFVQFSVKQHAQGV